jgi:hypothetical protein
MLLATVALAASWMVFLRPGAVETATQDATAPAQIAQKAKDAAAATDKASAATESATKALESTTATPEAKAETKKTQPPAAKPQASTTEKAKTKTLDGQSAVLRDMDAGKVVVLVFFDKAGADDRAARDAAERLNRRDGKVAVHAVAIEHVGDYGSVTQGVNVTQSPTTMVIAPRGTARAVTGLTERTEVDQLVRDALAAE